MEFGNIDMLSVCSIVVTFVALHMRGLLVTMRFFRGPPQKGAKGCFLSKAAITPVPHCTQKPPQMQHNKSNNNLFRHASSECVEIKVF